MLHIDCNSKLILLKGLLRFFFFFFVIALVLFCEDVGHMLDVKVESSRFHWPAVAGIKEQLFMKWVSDIYHG